MSPLFITFEGIDGSGKSTQAERLHKHLLSMGHDVVYVREPGSTALSEVLRGLVLDHSDLNVSDRAEAMLYSAARAQLVAEVIIPSLAEGKIVLCDRYSDSTVAYQGYGRELPLEEIITTQRLVTQNIKPNLTLYFDLTVEEANERRDGQTDDRLESAGSEFMERVREGYLEMAQSDPERWKLVNAAESVESLEKEIRAHVESKINE